MELWQSREIVYFLTWRDVKIRYKQTLIGIGWAVLQPLLAMVVFSVFFGRFARIPSDGVPYPLFAYCGLVVWQFFAHALTEATRSLLANEHLIRKVYFPRMAVPLSAIAGGVVDSVIAFALLLVMMAWYGVLPGIGILALPLALLVALATALAVGIGLSALSVQFRDVRYTLAFLSQLWLFATPVVYPSSLVPERWRMLYGLNPMSGVLETARWSLLGAGSFPAVQLLVSAITAGVLLAGAVWYFHRVERTLADVI